MDYITMFSKISINAIGKTQSEYIELEKHYLKLLKTKINFNIYQSLSYLSPKEQIQKESEILSQKINRSEFIISLDPQGQTISTETFAQNLRNWSDNKHINFIIGGSYGLSEEIKKSSNYLLSLSKLTFPHQLAKIILLEQIYRAETIFSGKNYHK